LGGGGGVSVPFELEGADGSKGGSPPSRDVGGFSGVELRVAPVPGRTGTVAPAEGVSTVGGSTIEGTVLIESPAGPSGVTVVPGSQFLHGVETGAGIAYTGRYAWRLFAQPTMVAAAMIDTATGAAPRGRKTIAASSCRAIVILLARLRNRPTSPVGSHKLTSCKRDAEPLFDAFATIDQESWHSTQVYTPIGRAVVDGNFFL
jgi:hypothetical protein